MAKIDVSAMTTLSNRVSEAFKSLRANIEFCGKDQRVIAIHESGGFAGRNRKKSDAD